MDPVPKINGMIIKNLLTRSLQKAIFVVKERALEKKPLYQPDFCKAESI
jgi:hypothetical protein